MVSAKENLNAAFTAFSPVDCKVH